MDKERFLDLLKRKQTGERVRVLWEMLMELIGAEPEIERVEFWQKLKSAFEDEIKAFEEMSKAGLQPQKQRRKRKPEDKILEHLESEGHRVVTDD